ncbi:MAG: oligosaccharide flippase family protein [Rhodopseudomonas sp.]|nr:oligosaccharide flippase family protein [Rhodopseudomonas sp.]
MTVARRLVPLTVALFAGRLAGAFIAFVTQALIARSWSAATLGEYLFLLASINVAATLMPLGFQVVGGYFAAEYRAARSRRSLRAYLGQSYLQIVAVIAILAAFLAVARFWAAPTNTLRDFGLPCLLMAAATAFIYVNGAVLVGLKHPVAGLFADTLLRPLLAIAAFFAVACFAGMAQPLIPLMWIVAIGYAGIALCQMLLTHRAIRTVGDEAPPAPTMRGRWWRFALPWTVIALATDFFFDIDLLLLGHMMNREELAVFGVCARICSLLGFGVATAYTVMMPDILESAVHRNEGDFLRRLADTNLVATGFAIALTACMFLTGPLLALMFGSRFADAGFPLGIMSLAFVIRAAFGPASLVLSFYDRPYAGVPAAVLGLVSLLIADAILVPAFGLIGAAWGATIATGLWCVTLWLTALRNLKIDVSVLPRLQTILCGA